ncbi:MAG: 16S rRNA (uracil(1498)-N(3))-methyltransferase [Lachnospiraceae bacterium]|nr:16S rRNA (uracil(1498)-N(3))-methyltransferase [Lachnospiraceae bacterium]
MHHFFVTPQAVKENRICITGPDVNHMKNVLRMKTGEEVLISDGEGKDYCCTIDTLSDEEIIVQIIDDNFEGTELSCEFYLFQGLPKNDKMEMIIQKAVELGVKEVIPVATKRAVVKLDEKKADKKIQRWQAISESAAKQSRRGVIPKIQKVMGFGEALTYAQAFHMNLIPYENFKGMKETKEALSKIREGMKVGIFIGPEGGFDEREVALAIEKGVQPISLGKRILRTETAGMAILSVLMFQLEK